MILLVDVICKVTQVVSTWDLSPEESRWGESMCGCAGIEGEGGVQAVHGWIYATLALTQGQIDGFCSQLPFNATSGLPEVASVGD